MSHAAPARRRTRTAAATALLALGLAGCSATNPMQTQTNYDPSDGVSITVDGVHVGNLVVVSGGQGEPGTVVGFAANRGREATDVVIQVAGVASDPVELGASRTLLVGPDRDIVLDLDAVPVLPGSMIEATVVTDRGGSDSALVPVMDGTLEEYAALLP